MKELIMKYVTICLMHKMSNMKKKKKKKTLKAMVGLRHMGQSIFMQRFKTCYYCDNWATLCGFATRQITTSKKTMSMHLQHHSKHICVSGS